ncbi:NfeD family protein [Pelagibacterium sediminicola]|uniref:NfeD family protein n=1 Tax=Pelagibacterium sediminicola TaxID=2248761 RepID=UPI000E311DB5|nr:NfeD family protein [Pelagibacterium sediminicola]
MAVIEFIAQYGGWSWIVLGLALLALELAVSGAFLVWLGAAAIVTGLAVIVSAISWPLQWALFGVLSLVLVAGWLGYQRRRYGKTPPSESPMLNRRTARYLEREVVLAEAIKNGMGRVHIEDSIWQVTGPDLPAGASVRIVGAKGPVLVVEPVGLV